MLTIFITMALVSGLAMAADLKKLSLDDASSIGITIQTDSKVKNEFCHLIVATSHSHTPLT